MDTAMSLRPEVTIPDPDGKEEATATASFFLGGKRSTGLPKKAGDLRWFKLI